MWEARRDMCNTVLISSFVTSHSIPSPATHPSAVWRGSFVRCLQACSAYFIWRRRLRQSLVSIHTYNYTGLFITPSGISELDCATTKTDTAERSISTERERHSKFLSYLTGSWYVLSAVSVLVVAQPISEVPEWLMNNAVCIILPVCIFIMCNIIVLLAIGKIYWNTVHSLVQCVAILAYVDKTK